MTIFISFSNYFHELPFGTIQHFVTVGQRNYLICQIQLRHAYASVARRTVGGQPRLSRPNQQSIKSSTLERGRVAKTSWVSLHDQEILEE